MRIPQSFSLVFKVIESRLSNGLIYLRKLTSLDENLLGCLYLRSNWIEHLFRRKICLRLSTFCRVLKVTGLRLQSDSIFLSVQIFLDDKNRKIFTFSPTNFFRSFEILIIELNTSAHCSFQLSSFLYLKNRPSS